MWRHYNVCLSLKYVIDKTKKSFFCEVGVGDGLTTWFALKTFEKEKKLTINSFSTTLGKK